jgi:hypothetical protein
MNRTFKNIVIAATLALSSVFAFGQTNSVSIVEVVPAEEVQPVETLGAKTIRQVPEDALEIKDFASMPKISGRWKNSAGDGSQEYDLDFSKKNLDWYTTQRIKKKGSCTVTSYEVEKVSENKDFLFVLTKRKSTGNVFCSKAGFPMLMEISKSKGVGGFYSLQKTQGTLE